METESKIHPEVVIGERGGGRGRNAQSRLTRDGCTWKVNFEQRLEGQALVRPGGDRGPSSSGDSPAGGASGDSRVGSPGEGSATQRRCCPPPLGLGPRKGRGQERWNRPDSAQNCGLPCDKTRTRFWGIGAGHFQKAFAGAVARWIAVEEMAHRACGGGGHSQKGGVPLNQALPPSPLCLAGSQLLWVGGLAVA